MRSQQDRTQFKQHISQRCNSCAAFVLLSVFWSVGLFAQRPLDMPQGESIQNVQCLAANQSLKAQRLVSTKASIYCSTRSGKESWNATTKIYTAPLNRKIVDLSNAYQLSDTVCEMAVVFDNGSSAILEINRQSCTVQNSNEVYASPVSVTAQNPVRKALLNHDLVVLIGSSVYRNTRDGSLWLQDTIGLNRASVADIVFDYNNNLVAATSKGLVRWQKSTQTWSRKWSGYDSTITTNSVFCQSPAIWYASTIFRGTYRSTDSAKTWLLDTTGIGFANLTRFAPLDSIHTVAYAQFSTISTFVYVRDAQKWLRVDSLITQANGTTLRCNDLAAGVGVELATTIGILSSDNPYTSWKKTDTLIQAEECFALQCPEHNVRLLSTNLGIFRRSQSGAWTKVFPQNSLSSGRPIISNAASPLSFVTQMPGSGSAQGLFYRSNDGGQTWFIDTVGQRVIPPATGANSGTTLMIDRRSQIYAGVSSTLMRTYSSNPWKIDTLGQGLKVSPSGSEICANLFADTDNTIYAGGPLYTGTGSEQKLLDIFLFKKKDKDSVWVEDTVGLNRSPICSMLRCSQGLFAASGIYTGNSQFFKKDGDHWQSLNTNVNAYSDARCMAVDKSGIIYVAYGHVLPATYTKPELGVYTTKDEGKTWLYAGLDSVMVRGLVADGDSMLAYTNRGVYAIYPHKQYTAQIAFAHKVLDFGDVTVGSSVDTSFQVRNDGSDTLIVDSFTLSDAAFEIAPKNFRVPALRSTNILLSFHPQKAGLFHSFAVPTCNAAEDTLELIGRGVGINAVDNPQTESDLWKCAPNPVNDRLRISPTSSNSQCYVNSLHRARIVDVLGQERICRDFQQGLDLDVSALAPGMYTVCIEQIGQSSKQLSHLVFIRSY